MKILYIASWYSTKEEPIKGSFFKEQFEGLNTHGVNGVVLALDLRSFRRLRPWGLSRKNENGLIVYRLSLPLGPIDIRIQCGILKILSKIVYKSIVKKEGEPDIIHAHAAECAGVLAQLIKKQFNKKVILTEHSSSLYEISAESNRFLLYRQAYNAADAIITVSPKFGQEINKIRTNHQMKLVHIPNLIDFNHFKLRPNKESTFTFITIGHLIDIKGIDNVVNAFALFNNKYPNSKLVIVGEGDRRESLKELVINLKLDNSVEFTGLISRDNLPKKISRAHCLVSGSRKETFGVVIIEAMACGLPVIATRCDGPSLIVNEKNGVLIEIDDIHEMYQAMLFVYENTSNFDSKFIRQSAESRFSTANVCNKIIDLYKQVLNRENES